jgi:hypothetical protein
MVDVNLLWINSPLVASLISSNPKQQPCVNMLKAYAILATMAPGVFLSANVTGNNEAFDLSLVTVDATMVSSVRLPSCLCNWYRLIHFALDMVMACGKASATAKSRPSAEV